MTEQGNGSNLKSILLGIFIGTGVTAPVTAYIVKKVCDKKQEAAVSKASEEAEQRGMQNMATYVTENVLNQEEPPKNDDHYAEKEEKEEDDAPDPTTYSTDIPGEETEEKAEEASYEDYMAHEQYLNMIERYRDGEVIPPRVISEEDYENDNYMQKSSVNWYDQDNVFEEDLHEVTDPYSDFGVTDGNELFRNAADRPDPDIVYVRNERKSVDFEISRIHGSYQVLVRGEKPIGEADT